MFEYFKKVPDLRPSAINIGSKVRAVRDFQTANLNIDRTIEGRVIAISNGRLYIRTDEGDSYECFSDGAVLLKDEPKEEK